MTDLEFVSYKYTVFDFASGLANKLYNDAKIDKKNLSNDFIRLKSLLVYSRVLDEYNLTDSEEDAENMFTREEMSKIANHINKLCGTNYNITFILTEEII